jgi:glycosyltransferase involved in cell wall biosynthesis
VLWQAERLAETYNFVAIRFEASPTKIEIAVRPIGEDAPLGTKLSGWMTTQAVVSNCVTDRSDDWIRTLRNPQPTPKVVELVVRAPFSPSEVQGALLSPTNALLATIGALRDSGFRGAGAGQRWAWREPYLPERSRYFELLRQTAGSAAMTPRLKNADGKVRVGMLVPVASFGGVEKVSYALAKVLGQHGCEVHLYVLGKPTYERHRDNDGVFASINFLATDYPIWGGPHLYAGHDLLMDGDAGAIAPQMLGFLSGLDLIVNNQVAGVNSVLGALRRKGAKVLNYVHVIDRSAQGRDAGHPYLTLAFEHVYDAVLTCSHDLEQWLHGMGVPGPKLVRIANAPSYEMAEADVQKVVESRDRETDRPLRALFLGRFDEQKGIERLHATVSELKRLGVGIDWRIVGRDVLSTNGPSWQQKFREIETTVLPPLYTANELTKAFKWADVVVLPSRWEGAPLTVLEAQRLGCVPISTAVGAVEELIKNGTDGIVIPHRSDGVVVRGFVETLTQLAGDRKRLGKLSDAGAKRAASLNWERSAEPLLGLLADWFPEQVAAPKRPKRRLISIRSERSAQGEAGI